MKARFVTHDEESHIDLSLVGLKTSDAAQKQALAKGSKSGTKLFANRDFTKVEEHETRNGKPTASFEQILPNYSEGSVVVLT